MGDQTQAVTLSYIGVAFATGTVVHWKVFNPRWSAPGYGTTLCGKDGTLDYWTSALPTCAACERRRKRTHHD